MPFIDWLLRQRYRDDVVGCFARDASLDPDRPSGIRAWRKHLKERWACEVCVNALERAWVEFRIAKQLRLDFK